MTISSLPLFFGFLGLHFYDNGSEFLVQGTITATSATDNYGAIRVTKRITVKGTGSTPVLDANSNGTDCPPTPHRIFTVENGAKLTLDGIQLENGNAGTENGGAILIKTGATADIRNTHIYRCKAKNGGAIHNKGTLILSVCHIGSNTDANEATDDGGAICSVALDPASCTIKGTDITYNKAGRSGGGICIVKGNCTIEPKGTTPTLIDHNVCSGSSTMGGGIYVGAAGSCTISGGTKITNNSSTGGGGICNSGTLEIKGSSGVKVEILGNSGTWGGGIYQVQGGTLTTEHTEIKKNTAVTDGGGIYVAGGSCTLKDGTILGDGGDDNTVTGSGSGGGVYVAGGAFVMESDARIVPSTGSAANTPGKNDVYLEQGKYITLNSALSGTDPVARITPSQYKSDRKILKGEDYTLTASDTNRFIVTPNGGDEWGIKTDGTLVLNAVTVDGTNPSVKAWEKLIQAVNNVAGGGTVTVKGTVQATSATDNYGAIVITKKITVKGEGANPELDANKNAGGKQGHRIFTVEDGGELTLETLTLKGGQPAGGHGGGMLINSGATVQLTDCCIEDCAATKYGGGIYVAVGASCTLDGVKMQGNTVNNGKGSAVYVSRTADETPTFTLKGDVRIGSGSDLNTICLGYAGSSSSIKSAFISATYDGLSGSSYINIEPEDYIKQSNRDLIQGKSISFRKDRFHLTNIPTSEGSWKLNDDLHPDRLALERTSANLVASGPGSWNALKEAIESLPSNGGTLTLNGTFIATSGDDSGEIIVRKVLTIDGGSSAVINADNKCRIFKMIDGSLMLKDITLKNGNATGSGEEAYGGGVYVKNGQFTMQGSTCIVPSTGSDENTPGKNDVYLKNGRTIDIVGVLTGSTPVARITPENYAYTTQVLYGAITAGTAPNQNYTKFDVTPYGSISWTINSSGCLQ